MTEAGTQTARKSGRKKRRKRKSGRATSEVSVKPEEEDDLVVDTASMHVEVADVGTDGGGPSSDSPTAVPVTDNSVDSASTAVESTSSSVLIGAGLAAQDALVNVPSIGGPSAKVNLLEGPLSLRDELHADHDERNRSEDMEPIEKEKDKEEGEGDKEEHGDQDNKKNEKDEDVAEARHSTCGTLQDDSSEGVLLAMESEILDRTTESDVDKEDLVKLDNMTSRTIDNQEAIHALSIDTDATSSQASRGHILVNGKCAMCGRSPIKAAPKEEEEEEEEEEVKPKKSVRFALDTTKTPALKSYRGVKRFFTARARNFAATTKTRIRMRTMSGKTVKKMTTPPQIATRRTIATRTKPGKTVRKRMMPPCGRPARPH